MSVPLFSRDLASKKNCSGARKRTGDLTAPESRDFFFWEAPRFYCLYKRGLQVGVGFGRAGGTNTRRRRKVGRMNRWTSSAGISSLFQTIFGEVGSSARVSRRGRCLRALMSYEGSIFPLSSMRWSIWRGKHLRSSSFNAKSNPEILSRTRSRRPLQMPLKTFRDIASLMLSK